MQCVSKLKGSTIQICTDLLPTLNSIQNELLAKARRMKDLGQIVKSQVKHHGTEVWLEVKNADSLPWTRDHNSTLLFEFYFVPQ